VDNSLLSWAAGHKKSVGTGKKALTSTSENMLLIRTHFKCAQAEVTVAFCAKEPMKRYTLFPSQRLAGTALGLFEGGEGSG
jgi:hypothetical protein